ncbi:integumentary mucin C.1-like isoform X3 [Hydra vulgaris]|uniref:integumentary mucin C.1-like isoform X4 n=1 Tax=Hydra vulgaris TaxID=6087 RepID=UPI001F5EE26F|nr:integumentary mucin C.1-like isoform X2 [Hydra vulgaris]XP_047133380.1 integumentary mucin C.1-like isoform X3 [Hydra vulgaris]XP_047133537.1 integumentary mucin C.1-like isoform X2 [Hydra vulgaris]XP_047133544.1 integumentary mucin C.1-like isoform X3 [Hydra vulgaris]XP_047144070.1 integumentary mucin C.1-like isoform X2 [Hydra vulgaris]XP_047144071.1 integumentary mucin C.1-like isoform X3 [Hydra vulgaris]
MNVNHGDETEVDNDGEDEIYHKRPDKDKALKKYRKLKLRLDDFMAEMRKTVSLLVSNSVTTASFSGTTSTSSSSDMTATAVTSGTTTIASPSDTTTTALTSGSTTTIALISGTTTIASSSGTTTTASSSGTTTVALSGTAATDLNWSSYRLYRSQHPGPLSERSFNKWCFNNGMDEPSFKWRAHPYRGAGRHQGKNSNKKILNIFNQ